VRITAYQGVCPTCRHDHSEPVTALASGSGDHAELARLAEAATPGPWVADVSSAKSYASVRVVNGPATRTGKATILRLQTALNSQRAEEALADAAFIAAANPAAVLALIAVVAALRGERDEWRKALSNAQNADAENDALLRARATEAERKLAEAVGLLRDWMGTWFVDADSRGENAIADDTRKFLSKEAERG